MTTGDLEPRDDGIDIILHEPDVKFVTEIDSASGDTKTIFASICGYVSGGLITVTNLGVESAKQIPNEKTVECERVESKQLGDGRGTCPPSRPHGGPRKFCSIRCQSAYFTALYRKRMRKRAILLKGGRCQESDCGRWVDLDDENSIKEFDFHHLGPTGKDYEISRLPSSSWPVLARELKKCILVCRRCHMSKYHGRLPFSSEDDRMVLAYRDHAERMGWNEDSDAGQDERVRAQAGGPGRGRSGVEPYEKSPDTGKEEVPQEDGEGGPPGSVPEEEGQAVEIAEGQGSRCWEGASSETARGCSVEEVPF